MPYAALEHQILLSVTTGGYEDSTELGSFANGIDTFAIFDFPIPRLTTVTQSLVFRLLVIPTDYTRRTNFPDLSRGPPEDYLAPTPNYIESDAEPIRQIAADICRRFSNQVDQTKAAYEYPAAHLIFAPAATPGALAALLSGRGQCGEWAALFCAICRACGIAAYTTAVFSFNGSGTITWSCPNHITAEAYVEPFGWIPVDPNGGGGGYTSETGFGRVGNSTVLTVSQGAGFTGTSGIRVLENTNAVTVVTRRFDWELETLKEGSPEALYREFLPNRLQASRAQSGLHLQWYADPRLSYGLEELRNLREWEPMLSPASLSNGFFSCEVNCTTQGGAALFFRTSATNTTPAKFAKAFTIGSLTDQRGGDYSFGAGQAFREARKAISGEYPAARFVVSDVLNETFLSTCSVLVLCGKRTWDTRLNGYTAAELDSIGRYATNGRSVLVLGDIGVHWGVVAPLVTKLSGATLSGGASLYDLQSARMRSGLSHPIIFGPFGRIGAYMGNWPGYFPVVGPVAQSLATNRAGTALLAVEPGRLGPGSGRIVLMSNSEPFANGFLPGNNRLLCFLAQPEFSTPWYRDFLVVLPRWPPPLPAQFQGCFRPTLPRRTRRLNFSTKANNDR